MARHGEVKSLMAPIDLTKLQTEGRNPRSANIDELSSLEICHVINREDAAVPATVTRCLPVIAAAVDALAERVRHGGRVIYVGAGTSGRLGVLDASEIPPTYSAPPEQFVGLIAGGDAAIRYAQEGAEDSEEAAEADLGLLSLHPGRDALIGIAASGQTPYVLGCLTYAKGMGCVTVGVACSSPSKMEQSGLVDYMIVPVTGPEVVTGSTRMKAGTATKLVLNTLSTAVMIKVGKTFGNMMVDLKPSNNKLMQRSRNIIRSLSGHRAPSSDEEIDALLSRTGGSVKLALAVLLLDANVDEARERLHAAGGRLSEAIQKTIPSNPDPLQADASLSELVLCVDGGATKCAAVVMDSSGRVGRGQAGPCNVTDYDIPTVTAAVSHATLNAVQDFTKTSIQPHSLRSIGFRSVWIGLAGYERASIQPQIQTALSRLFRLPIGRQLRASADVDLLASRLGAHSPDIHSAITLIAGTGSIAMRYELRNGVPIRSARSGGWGHLLGDDGSGFDLGREAIRHTLSRLDQVKPSDTAVSNLGVLSSAVLKHLGLDANAVSNADLVTAIMMPQISPVQSDGKGSQDHRARIASLGRVVLDLAATDPDASRIMQRGIEGLVRILLPLISGGNTTAADMCLILGGGLMQHQLYREGLLAKLARNGFQFQLELVDNPAEAGAILLKQNEGTVLKAKL